MIENIYGLTDLSNEALVEVIRKRFLLEADTNPQLYDPIDVERCRKEDWQIERFLLEKGTPDEALKALVKAMQWKKSFGVHERNQSYFPKELPLIFGHQMTSRDREGRLCSWSHSHIYKKISDFDELFKQYIAHHAEATDRKAGNKGLIMIDDDKGLSYSNMDMSIARFGNGLSDIYPQLLKIGCSVDLPWFLNSSLKVIRAIAPKSIGDKILLIKREELTKHLDIDVNEIPVIIGGNRETVYEGIDEMLPLNECQHLGFNDKQINNFYKFYNFDKIKSF